MAPFYGNDRGEEGAISQTVLTSTVLEAQRFVSKGTCDTHPSPPAPMQSPVILPVRREGPGQWSVLTPLRVQIIKQGFP